MFWGPSCCFLVHFLVLGLSRTQREFVGPPWHKLAIYLLAMESFSAISVSSASQTTKSASLGGRQVLNCQIDLPGDSDVPHIIQWIKDGLDKPVFIQFDDYLPNIHSQFHDRIRLIDGVSLEISHIMANDEGWYECTVIFVDGVDDNKKNNGSWVYLNVHTPPTIIKSSPSSIKKRPGETVALFCQASGSPEPTISWTKNEVTLLVSQRIILNNKGTEVEIKNLQWSDTGTYICTFNNSVGKISQLINLIIEGGAYILSPPVNRTVIEGQRITFTCGADAYPANITYQWFKDNQNVNLLPGYLNRINIYRDGSLIISSVTKDDMGWYVCRPSNGFGVDPEASAYLNVTYCPKFLEMPSQVTWARGYQARLDCPFDANPSVTEVMWTKNGYIVDFSSTKLAQLRNGSMYVEQVTEHDSGTYSCSPICSLGRGKSSRLVQIIVRDPPRFILRPDDKYIRIPEQPVMMPCDAIGTPEPIITWRKVRGTIAIGGRIRLDKGNLTIQDLVKDDHGQYECEAKNDVTVIVTTTELIIQMTTPHAPYNITVVTGPFSATIRWIPAYNGGSIQKYLLWFRNFNEERAKWQTLQVNSPNTTSYTVYGLQPDTMYEFMVLSRNQYGDGNYSERVQSRTAGYTAGVVTALPVDAEGSTFIPPIDKSLGPKPATPVNVSAVLRGNNIVIRWRAPNNTMVEIFYYLVHYLEGYAKTWKSTGVKISVPETSYIFKNIKPGTDYKFRVFSNGVMAYSPPSRIVKVSTPSDAGFFLSTAEIGGIVGGLLFLLVAVLLAVIAVICSKKKDRKRTERYGNVKYIGPADGTDNAKIESAAEWDNWNSNRGRDAVSRVDIGKGIFILPQPSEEESENRPQKFPHDSRFYDRDRERGYKVPVHDAGDSMEKTSYLLERSCYIHNDDNGFLSHDGTLKSRKSPWKPPSSRDCKSHSSSSLPNEKENSLKSQDSKRHKSPQQSNEGSPVTSPVYRGYDGPFFSFQGDGDDVFPPINESYPPLSRPSRPSLPRHSSMKPASLQTYLTDDPCDIDQPFEATDLSSVLPSSILEQSLNQSPQYYDPKVFVKSPVAHSHDLHRNIPYHGKYQEGLLQAFQPNYEKDFSHRQFRDWQSSYLSQNRTFPRDEHESSDSNGRPIGYTREHLQGVVDKIRRGPRARKSRLVNRNSAPELDFYYPESPSFTGSLAPRSQNHSESDVTAPKNYRYPHDFGRPYGYKYDIEPFKAVKDSRTSVSSSGKGSSVGRPRAGAVDLRPHPMDEATPDSISSGIGSRNTSQATGSSLMSRVPRTNASLNSFMPSQEQDFSADSPYFFDPGRYHHRDISADENYEFDSVNALETDLMDALQNYSQHWNGNNQLVTALETGLTGQDFYNDLYPKPSRQSKYGDSEKRFERLREEFQEYRQKQQEHHLDGLAPMDSEML